MIPFDLRDFINVMSVVIFGGVILSCVMAFFAYALAINRKKRAKRSPPTDASSSSES